MTAVPTAPRRAASASAAGAATVPVLLAVAALFVPGVASFGPVFGGVDGYVAAGGGVALGLAIGWTSRRWRWSLAATTAVTVAAYLLFGGALALRRTTLFGFIPTPETLVRLVTLSVQSWRDLLTVGIPASNFVGPAVMPYLSGLVLGLLGARAALAPRRYLLALLPPLVLLLLGIAWGLDVAPFGVALGLGYGVMALAWAAWRQAVGGRATGERVFVSGGAATLARRRLTGALAMIVGGALATLAATPLLATADRHVLRQDVRPPLDVQQYASPLTTYRFLELDQRKVGLFTVAGLPAGGRVRLAALDAYDGRVYSVADASAGFARIGGQNAGGTGSTETLSVGVQAYAGVWLPGGGDVRGVTFSGPHAAVQSETAYYSPFGGTLLATAGVAEGDAYQVSLLPAVQPADLPTTATPTDVGLPEVSGVPDVIGQAATEYAGEATTPVEQLRAIEKRLQAGYYSDGADGRSTAGHYASRIAAMLSKDELIGDDEQYAVAMALMARQLGIPARVVMGFYPDSPRAADGPLQVTGEMAHVWVEVPFASLGWVHFDPTPDRDRRPQTTKPKPKPTPRPQVLPPPEPPVDKVDAPLDDPGKKRDSQDDEGNDLLVRIAVGIGIGLGVATLVGAPFLVVGGLKHRRRSRRENDPVPANRVSGAWAELVDAATDLGTRAPRVATRREAAAVLSKAHPEAAVASIAEAVDSRVFGATAPSVDEAAHVWAEVDTAVVAMRGSVGRWRRLRGSLSLRSFRTARASGATRRGMLPRPRRRRTP